MGELLAAEEEDGEMAEMMGQFDFDAEDKDKDSGLGTSLGAVSSQDDSPEEDDGFGFAFGGGGDGGGLFRGGNDDSVSSSSEGVRTKIGGVDSRSRLGRQEIYNMPNRQFIEGDHTGTRGLRMKRRGGTEDMRGDGGKRHRGDGNSQGGN